ncbi:MAG: thioredoxin family protein [Tannerellaceae bacterium]|jgi:peroxiredoxin|nr:thioredoxin family protein [Tannerellaceae bacterium]
MKGRCFIFAALLAHSLWDMAAQQVALSFPGLPEREARVYYYKGGRPDSLVVWLDERGKGQGALPAGYAFVQVYVPGSGAIECIGGEPLLQIACRDTFLRIEHTEFPGSRENNFLYRVFGEKEQASHRQMWLQFGLELYDSSHPLYPLLDEEKWKNEERLSSLAAQIKDSSLYASRLLGLIDFLDDMGLAIDRRDTVLIREIKERFHHRIDWEALYSAGQLWEQANFYYAALFGLESHYAEDILPLLDRLPEPMRSAFMETVYGICEKSGWNQAKERLASYLLEHEHAWNVENEFLKRILAAEKLKPGNPAPLITGLPDGQTGGITLLLFYESGCDACMTELEELKKQYARLHRSGIRVVTVSADTDERVYAYHSRSFPWPDTLCDYNGFAGENFTHYAIIATPTVFVIGNGIIIGSYYTLADTKL